MKRRKWLIILVTLCMVFALMPASVFATEDIETPPGENVEEGAHYLAFASDLHGLPDVLENAMKGFPSDTEYVSLIGDMVGEKGGDAPEFQSSEVYNRIVSIIEGIPAEQTSIIWADHDAGVKDDAKIVKCPGGYESGQIYEGKNADGSTAYYIYGIGFYHMTKGGSTSEEAAKAFKDWVSDKDETIPILVLCHVPLQAKRGDNFGASYWNEALNFAATGIEGITGTDTEEDIIRNVIYLYGHNHTTDKTEYVFRAGTTMTVQIDSTIPAGALAGSVYDTQDQEIIATEVTDEEYDDLTAQKNAKAEGVVSDIYYTAMIPGYLKTSGNATLIRINDNTINFTKYNGAEEVSLGTDGESGEVMESSIDIDRIKWADPVYEWSDDYSTVTAKRTATTTERLSETETVKTKSVITREASCEETGVRTYTAVFENPAFEEQTQQEVIDALGHKEDKAVTENNQAATCEASGSYDLVVYCTTCGKELSRVKKTVDALGHDWGEWKVTKKATESQEGQMTRTCRNDDSHVETKTISKIIPIEPQPIVYTFSKGTNGSWTKGSAAGFDLTVNRSVDDDTTFRHFTGIEIDGQIVAAENYTAASGSINITLKAGYLEGLSTESHNIKVKFDDGTAETTLQITAPVVSQNKDALDTASGIQSNRWNAPNTGDSMAVGLWCTLAVIGVVALSIITIRLKKATKK